MAAHLIELLLPLTDNAGHRYPSSVLDGVKRTLVERFGGVTAHARAPAEGVWAPHAGTSPRDAACDQIVIVEVMASEFDKKWWTEFAHALERSLKQQKIVIRAFAITTV